MSASSPPDLLAAIVAATRARVAEQAVRVPRHELDARVAARTGRVGRFRAAVSRAGHVNVIAECKRRSPSRGILRRDYDPASIARGYERAGAAAVSVLTEPGFFDGSLEHLAAVRAAVGLPILRKDFIVDDYQVVEAAAAGADALLLIASALDDAVLRGLRERARGCGLDALVEIHDEGDLDRALRSGADMIGVNNRDLRTLSVDVEASHRLAHAIPDGVVSIAESGLRTGRDLSDLRRDGYDAFLVGERFMTADDPGAALADLIRDASVTDAGAVHRAADEGRR